MTVWLFCPYSSLSCHAQQTKGPLQVGRLGFQDLTGLATLSLIKMLISSYEEPDWPGYWDLVVCDGDLSYREDDFPARVTGTKLFGQNSFAFAKRPKWHNLCLLWISALGVWELALLVKLQESTKLRQLWTIHVYYPPFWLFLQFHPGNRTSPVTGLIWRGLKRKSDYS